MLGRNICIVLEQFKPLVFISKLIDEKVLKDLRDDTSSDGQKFPGTLMLRRCVQGTGNPQGRGNTSEPSGMWKSSRTSTESGWNRKLSARFD
jgi:hypothetical protein